MEHAHDTHGISLRRVAFSATLHCLTGCGIGEVLGLVIADALGWSTVPAIALAVVLAFFFGYSLTLRPLFRAGVALGTALGIAFAVDTLSITVMEIVDNAIILVIPGAMEAGIGNMLFWGSLAFALAVAFVAAYPVNYWLLTRGRGHALMHEYH
jgi:putative flippase GtrA